MNNDNRYLHLIRQGCPLPPGTHVVVYYRDSGGDEQDRSVAQQVDVAREYCQHHNLVLDKLYVDESKLSSNTEKRDALQELLSDLRRRFRHINDRYKREKASHENPFGVIFWKSNRLGRDSIEATNIKTDLRLRAITIVDLVTSANTDNAPVDALIEVFQQWKDEQDLEEISQNAKRGLAQLVGTRDNDPEFLRYNPDWDCTGSYLGIRPGGAPTGFKGERMQVGVYERKKGRIIQQFVAKIVIKEGTGTCNRAFPFPDDSYMPGFRDLDLRVSGTLTIFWWETRKKTKGYPGFADCISDHA
jgi:hypothetical protein